MSANAVGAMHSKQDSSANFFAAQIKEKFLVTEILLTLVSALSPEKIVREGASDPSWLEFDMPIRYAIETGQVDKQRFFLKKYEQNLLNILKIIATSVEKIDYKCLNVCNQMID